MGEAPKNLYINYYTSQPIAYLEQQRTRKELFSSSIISFINNSLDFDITVRNMASLVEIQELFSSALTPISKNIILIEESVSRLEAQVTKLETHVTTLETQVNVLIEFKGAANERLLREEVKRKYGEDFARRFTIHGLSGLARLVSICDSKKSNQLYYPRDISKHDYSSPTSDLQRQ